MNVTFRIWQSESKVSEMTRCTKAARCCKPCPAILLAPTFVPLDLQRALVPTTSQRHHIAAAVGMAGPRGPNCGSRAITKPQRFSRQFARKQHPQASQTYTNSTYAHIYIYIYIRILCDSYTYGIIWLCCANTHTYIYIYIYTYIFP